MKLSIAPTFATAVRQDALGADLVPAVVVDALRVVPHDGDGDREFVVGFHRGRVGLPQVAEHGHRPAAGLSCVRVDGGEQRLLHFRVRVQELEERGGVVTQIRSECRAVFGLEVCRERFADVLVLPLRERLVVEEAIRQYEVNEELVRVVGLDRLGLGRFGLLGLGRRV